MNELTKILKLIEERLAALVEAVANQEGKVSRLDNDYDAAILIRPREARKVAKRLIKARLILERLRGRFEEADKTYTLIKAHVNAKDGPNE